MCNNLITSLLKTMDEVNAVSSDHGVPVSTLRDRISERVVHGAKPYLSGEEEKELSSRKVKGLELEVLSQLPQGATPTPLKTLP